MHRPRRTYGRWIVINSPRVFSTLTASSLIAFSARGQISSHTLQMVLYAHARQRSVLMLANPIGVFCFSSNVIGGIAPVGHTSIQALHVKLQYPSRGTSRGVNKFCRPPSNKLGCSPCVGHTRTHSPQRMHTDVKSVSSAPGGRIIRSGSRRLIVSTPRRDTAPTVPASVLSTSRLVGSYSCRSGAFRGKWVGKLMASTGQSATQS